MKKTIISFSIAVCIIAFCLLQTISFAQSRDVPFTLEDRDRSIRMEEKINSFEKSMDVKFESQQQQLGDMKASIQDLRNLFYWAFGVMITLMTLLFGFIVWDRKTLSEPIRDKTQSLVQSLREYSKKQPELADILRSHGLM